jgi:catalase
MLKLITPVALGLLTVLSIAPKSEAIPINLNSIYFEQSSRDVQPRVIVNLGIASEHSNRWEIQRRQELAQQREREANRRRYRYYSRHDRYSNDRYSNDRGERGEYRGEYRGEFRHDR